MEEEATEIKASRIPKIDKIINYKDFFGEYPIIFAIKIISSLSLIYVISEFYVYHNPKDSLLTKYLGDSLRISDPNPEVFVPWGFAAGFLFYIFTIFKGRYKILFILNNCWKPWRLHCRPGYRRTTRRICNSHKHRC